MFMYVVQSWLLMLLFFVVGAIVAWIVVRLAFKPVDDVRAGLEDTSGKADQ